MDNPPKPWFSRKKFGWGFGPSSWQGWLVIVVYAMALRIIGYLAPPSRHYTDFVIGMVVATAALLAVCIVNGRPRQGR